MIGNSKTVLIVDDSPIIISRLKSMLEGLSPIGTVLQAESYAEALPILQFHGPDVVLLDIHLPDVNGIEVLRRIRKDHPSIFVIMLTNQADEYYRSRCKTLGAAYFIDKSTEFQLITQVLASLF